MTKYSRNPCKVCYQLVTKRTGFQCQGKCKKWVHFKCMSHPTAGRLSDMKKGLLQVYCPCPDCKPINKKKEFYIDTTCKATGCLAKRHPAVCSVGCSSDNKKICRSIPSFPEYDHKHNHHTCTTPVYPSPCGATPNPCDRTPSFFIRPEPSSSCCRSHPICTNLPYPPSSPCSEPIYPSPCSSSPDPNDHLYCPPTFYIRPKSTCDVSIPCPYDLYPDRNEFPPNNSPHYSVSATMNYPGRTMSDDGISSAIVLKSPSSQEVEDVCLAIEQLTGQVNTLLRTLHAIKHRNICNKEKKCTRPNSFICSCKKLLCRSQT
ncbi:uncharacterized protein LOC128680543 [Plodia interpunctella]|uniref:uncharacterized protein LOC128680543 n=1 Tax=Plodia interpunctella TaxID=58824 RepID=UPI00236755CE|nr:uncharacterized protein LOC128680543 [Plodia interpunctella]